MDTNDVSSSAGQAADQGQDALPEVPERPTPSGWVVVKKAPRAKAKAAPVKKAAPAKKKAKAAPKKKAAPPKKAVQKKAAPARTSARSKKTARKTVRKKVR
jgi:hypothetical protein